MNAHRLRVIRRCSLTMMMPFVLWLTPAIARADVTFEVLHSFIGGPDGDNPFFSALMQAPDGNLYGMTSYGGTTDPCVTGTHGCGTIFRMTPDGGFTTLYSFTGGSDGANPAGALIQANDGYLYGTTQGGGNSGCGATCGTLFRFNPDDGTVTPLHAFEDAEGVPGQALIQASDLNFYGTTGYAVPGRTTSTIFRITSDGTFTTLHEMNPLIDGVGIPRPLIQATDGNLYGTASAGGVYMAGTIFQITLDGTFRVMHTFFGLDDGNAPLNALLQASDGNFYGMTALGGFYAYGTIFQMTPDGTVTVLHSFSSFNDVPQESGLIEDADGNLYGTTQSFGLGMGGTAFQRAPDGTVTTLHRFDGGLNGFVPSALIQASDGNFYGTTGFGGSSNLGMVFRLVITP